MNEMDREGTLVEYRAGRVSRRDAFKQLLRAGLGGPAALLAISPDAHSAAPVTSLSDKAAIDQSSTSRLDPGES